MNQLLLKKIAQKSQTILTELIKKKFNNQNDLPEFILNWYGFNETQNNINSIIQKISADIFIQLSSFCLLEQLNFGSTNLNISELNEQNFYSFFDDLEGQFPFIFNKEVLEFFLPKNIFDLNGLLIEIYKSINDSNYDKNDKAYVLSTLYQNFNTDYKDSIFKNLRANNKIDNETLSSATLIYTPLWVVKYMVENTLGRFWIKNLLDFDSSLSEEDLINYFDFKYYVIENETLENNPNILSNQESSVNSNQFSKQLQPDQLNFFNSIPKQKPNPKDITILDPAVGSGNILIYSLQVLLKIYESEGISKEKAISSIFKNNLFGLDIDPLGLKLAQLNLIIAIGKPVNESFNLFSINDLNKKELKQVYTKINEDAYLKHLKKKDLSNFLENISLMGSLIKPVKKIHFKTILEFIKDINSDLYKALSILDGQFSIVITNPPYFGSKFLAESVRDFISNNYKHNHKDLYSAFIERVLELTKPQGYCSLIVQPSFLNVKTFKSLREDLIDNNSILSLLDIGRGIFGYDFGSTVFVIQKNGLAHYKGKYFRLHDEKVLKYQSPETYEEIFLNSLKNPKYSFNFNNSNDDSGKKRILYSVNQQSFKLLPETLFVFWMNQEMESIFKKNPPLSEFADSKQGMATTDNNRFTRFWYEVDFSLIGFGMTSREEAQKSGFKWFPYNKGGPFRKWYGNDEYIVNFENNGAEIKEAVLKHYPYLNSPYFVIKNREYYFKPSFTWSLVSSGQPGFRYKPAGYLFDVAGMSLFSDSNLKYLGALCNSVVGKIALEVINPTINFQCGDIARIPVILNEDYREEIEMLVDENIQLSKEDWDSYEKSWAFKKHPLIRNISTVEEAYHEWNKEAGERFFKLKKNEEKLNQIFIEIYGLKDVDPTVYFPNISIFYGKEEREVKSLLSYFIGCCFGRYSLDQEGLICSGKNLDIKNFKKFPVEDTPLLLITETNLKEYDIISRLEEFLKIVYGESTLEENLDYIASIVSNLKRGSSRDKIRKYFARSFTTEHTRLYRRRPIYWEINSGKSKELQALTYYPRFSQKVYQILFDLVLPEIIENFNNKLLNSSNPKSLKQAKTSRTTMKDKKTNFEVFIKNLALLSQSEINLNLDDGIVTNYLKAQKIPGGIQTEVLKNLHFEKIRKY